MTSKSDGACYSWDHCGIQVRFPFPPYPCQEKYTNAVVEAVVLAQNALLESPTGTGKTAALLAGAIAATRGTGGVGGARGGGGLREHGTGGRVIYASRTHSQLSQVVSQLRRLPLPQTGLKSVVLGSRDQLCIHPKVMEKTQAAEKIKLCSMLTKEKKCEFYNNFSKNAGSGAGFKPPESGGRGGGCAATEEELCDIEDFVAKHKRTRTCPYFQSRDSSSDADIVFVPYNYLLDSSIRATLNLSLNGSVIILDEAHNIMKTCEESASVTLETQDLAVAIQESDVLLHFLDTAADIEDEQSNLETDLQTVDVMLVKEFLSKMEMSLSSQVRQGKWVHSTQSYSGDSICPLLEGAGLTFDKQVWVLSVMDKMVDLISLLNTMGGKESGKGIAAVVKLVKAVFAESSSMESVQDDGRMSQDCSRRCVFVQHNRWCLPVCRLSRQSGRGNRLFGQHGEGRHRYR